MILKRSVSIRGHRTSVSVEDAFWQELTRCAERRNRPLSALIAEIDAARPPTTNLSSAIRLYVLNDALARLNGGEEPQTQNEDRSSPT